MIAGPGILYNLLTRLSQELSLFVQVGNGIELEAVGLQFEPYRWRPLWCDLGLVRPEQSW